MASNGSHLTLLHLSDLHIRDDAEQKTDCSMVLDPLLERLEADYKKGLQPELVLISGDIAFQGIKAEYELALPFLKDVLKVLGLDEDRLYLVPGNHDVQRKAYRPRDIPAYETNREINEELSDDGYRADLLKGMRDYFAFIREHFPHMKSGHGDLAPFVNRVKSKSGQYIGLVGLNSAWMHRTPKPGEDDKGRLAIGQYQIKSAFEELAGMGGTAATVALFHHPLSWLAPMDRQVCEKYLNRTIALAGHLHEPGGGFFQGFSGQMVQIQAGGAYLGSDSNWPSRYQYIGIDLGGGSLRLDFRAFPNDNHEWYVDGKVGDDGVAEIQAGFLLERAAAATAKEAADQLPEFPEAYAELLKSKYGFLEADRLNPKAKAPPLSLPDLFVPLYCADPDPDKKRAVEKRSTKADHMYGFAREGTETENTTVGALAGKYRALLIEGQAGCGKSTVLKHLAYSLSPVSEIPPASTDLAGYLPVLVLLKDLQAYCESDIGKLDRPCAPGDGMVEWYLKNRAAGKLEPGTLKAFAKCGRLLLLVDGLDEIDRPLRDYAVNSLAELTLDHPENKIVLAGRPHGLDGAPHGLYAKFRTSVEELSKEQIERFIRQWFGYIYPGTEGVGKTRSEDLLADIKEHPAIDALTVNPLMLTAICLLYHDEKELPNQRAELLKKFIDNMLWRRFPKEAEAVLDRLKGLAHEMQLKRVREVDQETAVKLMSRTADKLPNETPRQFNRRMKELFKHIEPRCGLLINQKGQTGFWHLVFQEFLTAQQLMDISEDKKAAIAVFWDDERFKEVIELYVSYLSIDNKLTANNIVQEVVQKDDQSPYRRWRLAARAMMDFHQSRRNLDVLHKVEKRLKQIIQKPLEPATLMDAGETLGWLGDDREMETYAPIAGGQYDLEKIGKRTMQPFELGRYPVTNRAFERFVNDRGYDSEALWTRQGKLWLRDRKPRQPNTWPDRKYRCPNQPVTGVCWYEAAAYCAWLSENDPKHRYFLPSADQWQAAAAGKEKREYPWGDESPTGRCNIDESKIGRPSPVGIFASGRTPGAEDAAIHDLAGNVWEWTCTNHKTGKTAEDFKYDKDWDAMRKEGLSHLMGGSWYDEAQFARCANRSLNYPADRDDAIGFRCARTLL
jgi:formylglycine-generating enzyme required for sulfatase activity/energy-coupling factor transporter ATP-binding protein EcfA2